MAGVTLQSDGRSPWYLLCQATAAAGELIQRDAVRLINLVTANFPIVEAFNRYLLWLIDQAAHRPRQLLDGVSERFGIFSDAVVPCDDGEQRRRLAEQLRGCKVDGVERPNRFDWKRTADSIEHRSINVENEAATL